MLCSSLHSFSQCYNLIWSDEFNGTSLNTSDWNYNIGDGCPNLCGWGNGELEYYTNSTDNVDVDNGILTITAIRETTGGSEFTSGKIDTRNKHNFKYGRFEARMRLPEGYGLWPAFWMLRPNTNWPQTGEIDIMEYRGDLTDEVDGTLHYGSSWPNNQWDGTKYTTPVDLHTDFHEYAVEWDINGIKWFVDGILFKEETKSPNSLNPQSTDDPWPWDEDFYIILNLAVGGWYAGGPSANDVQLTKPTFEIDYVRVYDLAAPVTSQSPYNGSTGSLPGTIEFEDYDESCAGIGWNDNSTGNQGHYYRADGVDIEACTDIGGGYNVGWTEAMEWMEYTVNVAQSGDYDFNFRVASGDGDGGIFHVEIDNTNVSGAITVNNTGGWQTWTDINLNDIAFSAGNHILKIEIDNGGINLNNFSTTTIIYDCNNDPNGTAYNDNCNNCVEGNTGLIACNQDCNGDWGGAALTDNCNNCVDGNTGQSACTQDCNGDWGGSAENDVCGTCAGGNTSITPITNVNDCITGLNNQSFESILIYPNPSAANFSINNASEIKSYQILTISGSVIETGQNDDDKLSFGANLSPGIYFLKLNGRSQSIVLRIVKN